MIVDYDIYDDGETSLLFCIEEDEEDIVHSPVLDKDIKTGAKVVIYKKNDDKTSVTSGNIEGYQKIREYDFDKVKPWMITVGQMDEDDDIEVFIGCYYDTMYYKKADTRPYFFEYKDGVLSKQWTGSYLNSLAFHNAELMDVDKDGYDELRVFERVIIAGEYVDRVNYYGISGFYPYLKDIK